MLGSDSESPSGELIYQSSETQAKMDLMTDSDVKVKSSAVPFPAPPPIPPRPQPHPPSTSKRGKRASLILNCLSRNRMISFAKEKSGTTKDLQVSSPRPFLQERCLILFYSTGKTTGGRKKEKRRVIREMEGEVHNPIFQQLIQIASSSINQNETTRDSNAKRRHKRNVGIHCKSSLNSLIDYAS